MKGMDMNHSKGWKGRHQAEANGYVQGSQRKEWKWIILRKG
jgi:hypothetical protein